MLDDLVAVHRLDGEHIEDRRAHVAAADLRTTATTTEVGSVAGLG